MRTLTLTVCFALALGVSVRAEEKAKEPEIITRLKKAKVDGPFTLIVHVQVKKDQVKAFLGAAKPCVAATVKEKGCVAYELHQDSEDPAKFVFFEKWKSVKDLAAHFEEDHLKKLAGALPDLVDGAPKFAFYQDAK